MEEKDILNEIEKCKESPYYFAITYLRIKNLAGEEFPYTTHLNEKQFNEKIKNYEKI